METEQKIELLSRHLTPQRLEKIMRVSADRTRYVTVVLENIFYTQNFSAVTRTCECLGIQDLYQIGTATQGRLNSDVAKGASLWVDIHRKTNQPAAQAAAALKAAGYRIVAAMPTADAKPFTELDLSAGKIAVAMGNETDGTGEEIKNLADEFLRFRRADSSRFDEAAAGLRHRLAPFRRRVGTAALPLDPPLYQTGG